MSQLLDYDLTTSQFGFSAVSIDDLGATEYTLVTIAVDASSSVGGFKPELEKCLKEIVTACRKSPRADNLLLRILTFGSNLNEMHGFKTLENCNEDDYDDSVNPYGMTALADATVNAAEAIGTYGKDLFENDYLVNGILIVVTDGGENHSTNTEKQAKNAIAKVMKDECLESLVSILVGVNVSDSQVAGEIQDFNAKVDFDQYIEVDNATAGTLAKLAKFVSQSISSQSQALGSGTASQPIKF